MTTSTKNGTGATGQKAPRKSTGGRDALVALPFAAFAHCVAGLLSQMGYEDVRIVGRAAGGGRNGDGGYDILCYLREGAARRKVIVLLKQFGRDAWVFQRMVDELRGVAIRDGADEALLITTGPISSVVEACEGPGLLRPRVRRIDGERLRRLLAASEPSTSGGGTGRRSYRWRAPADSGNTPRSAQIDITLTVRTESLS